MYNVHCSLHLVHGSNPLSLRRASPPVHVACLLDDQDLFLKTKQKEIENICRGCRFLTISEGKKLKSRSRLRMSSFREERFFSHFKFFRSIDATCSDCHFAAVEPLPNFIVQPGPVCSNICLTKPWNKIKAMTHDQWQQTQQGWAQSEAKADQPIMIGQKSRLIIIRNQQKL